MEPAVYIVGFVVSMMAIGALYSFHWAAKTGQMENLKNGACVIFDEEEKEGVITDAFPDRKYLPKNPTSIVFSVERIKS